jgi:nitrite reductase/ring-hydroxylating ferredoxin subunit
MGILNRILGICTTPLPGDASCWKYADGRLEIDLGRAPELKEAGGALRIEGEGAPSRRVLVFKGDDGQYHAVVNRCTHIGHRRLDPLPGQNAVRCCSISKSTFNYQGEVVSGPTRKPISVLDVKEQEGRLIISV